MGCTARCKNTWAALDKCPLRLVSRFAEFELKPRHSRNCCLRPEDCVFDGDTAGVVSIVAHRKPLPRMSEAGKGTASWHIPSYSGKSVGSWKYLLSPNIAKQTSYEETFLYFLKFLSPLYLSTHSYNNSLHQVPASEQRPKIWDIVFGTKSLGKENIYTTLCKRFLRSEAKIREQSCFS